VVSLEDFSFPTVSRVIIKKNTHTKDVLLDPDIKICAVFFIRIKSRVDLAMSVCLSNRMNFEISGTIKAIRLRFSIQILETKTQRKFVDPCCHAHYNAQKPYKTSTPTLLNYFY